MPSVDQVCFFFKKKLILVLTLSMFDYFNGLI